MSLYTRCILSEREVKDGTRISVMSRHTLQDGYTPDNRITASKYDLHLPQFGPHPKLIGDYYKRALPWDEFEIRYLQQLQTKDISQLITNIATRALNENITFLCIEPTADFCHRRLLAQECLKKVPSLSLEHR